MAHLEARLRLRLRLMKHWQATEAVNRGKLGCCKDGVNGVNWVTG